MAKKFRDKNFFNKEKIERKPKKAIPKPLDYFDAEVEISRFLDGTDAGIDFAIERIGREIGL